MDVLERIKRGYRGIGHGAPRDVLAMFHQEQADPPQWVVDDSIKLIPARDVVAMDLFAGMLPSHWEVIGVDLRNWEYYADKARLVVTGMFRSRPKGTWEVMPLPFVHIWRFDDQEQVRGVFDYFAGVEVVRLEDVRARRRRRFWRGGDASAHGAA